MGIKVQFTIQPTATSSHHQASLPWKPVSSNYDHNDHNNPFDYPCHVFGQNKISSSIQAPESPTQIHFECVHPGTQHIILSVSSESQCYMVCTEAFSIKYNFVAGNPNQLHSIWNRQSWRLKFYPYNPGGSKETTPESCSLHLCTQNCTCEPVNTLNKTC